MASFNIWISSHIRQIRNGSFLFWGRQIHRAVAVTDCLCFLNIARYYCIASSGCPCIGFSLVALFELEKPYVIVFSPKLTFCFITSCLALQLCNFLQWYSDVHCAILGFITFFGEICLLCRFFMSMMIWVLDFHHHDLFNFLIKVSYLELNQGVKKNPQVDFFPHLIQQSSFRNCSFFDGSCIIHYFFNW